MATALKYLFKRMSKKRLAQINGEIILEGLKENVEIIRDKWGIPHIYADNEYDLFFAQGFVHAQDRLWQMELLRRTANGTLSEILGDLTLSTDRATRTFGFRRNGQRDFDAMEEEEGKKGIKNAIIAHTDGINAYLSTLETKLPLEFSLLKHTPEPWTIGDTMAFGELMQWQLSGQFHYKLYRSLLWDKLEGDMEKIKEIDPNFPIDLPHILTDGIEFNIYENGILKAFDGPYLKRRGGSNGWSIAKELTETGAPIHCNDPHLGPSQPSIWYACHLICKETGLNVMGVGPSPLPMVLIGHNDYCSWGFTVANLNCEDLFIEKINPENPFQYEYKGEWVDAEVIEEKIYVKDLSEPYIENVIITRHGPIISDSVNIPDKKLALQSYVSKQDEIFKGVYMMNHSKSWDEFITGVSLFGAPQQNITYADVDGNIGSYISGKVPIRAKGDGTLPVPGWTGEYEWIDEIPFEKMPHCFNPKSGYVVTANNCAIPDKEYPYYLTSTWDPGFRAKRIREILKEKIPNKFKIEDMKKIHADVKSLSGLQFVEILKDFKSEDEKVNLALNLLRAWDGLMTRNRIGSTVYELSHDFLLKLVLFPVLGEELGGHIMGTGFHPLLKGTTDVYHPTILRLFNLLKSPDSWWVKKAGGLHRWIEEGLKLTINYLIAEQGPEVTDWEWGKLNKIVFPHSMSIKKPLDKIFNVGPYPIGGDKLTVCQMGSPVDDYGAKEWAPSYRQIIDLSDFSKSVWIYAPGQSGNLVSPHYSDLFDIYYKNEYIPMVWTRKQIEDYSEGTLIIKPQ